jgi:hypothetical protein
MSTWTRNIHRQGQHADSNDKSHTQQPVAAAILEANQYAQLGYLNGIPQELGTN